MLSEANGVLEKVSGGSLGLTPALAAVTGENVQPMSRFASRSAVGAALGPSLGTTTDIIDLTASLGANGELSDRDIHTLRRLAPF